MDEYLRGYRSSTVSPIDRPLDALKSDHYFIRQLFERFLGTQDIKAKEEDGPRIIELLELHALLEESIFYPRVRALDPALVERCEEEHQQHWRLMEQLKRMDVGNRRYEELMWRLFAAVMQHVQREEQLLLPKVQQANLDLTEIGLQMQAYEANIVNAAIATEAAARIAKNGRMGRR
jgi:hemerythrin superfamily protein